MSATDANAAGDPPPGTPPPSPDRAATATGTAATVATCITPSPSKVSIEALVADQKAVLDEKAVIVLTKKPGTSKSIVWDPDFGMCELVQL